ncbi:hypothetical protein BDN67DRAFT_1012680 [Paxillus ammoniavirescens]|nr:hypothetical protein BDN67DRAFT_1012680 [Paxillus ammoniavirescens]
MPRLDQYSQNGRATRTSCTPLQSYTCHEGNFFASSSWDQKTVRLCDIATRQQIGPTFQHAKDVNSVAISCDGLYPASGADDKKVCIWSLQYIVPESLLENAPTNSVHDEDSQQVPNPPSSSQESPDMHNGKDGDKNNSKGVDTHCKGVPASHHPYTSSFMCPAIASIREATDTSDQLYDNFSNDLPDALPPDDGPPKKRLSKLPNKLTRKKDRGAETQLEQKQVGAGVEEEPTVDFKPPPVTPHKKSL